MHRLFDLETDPNCQHRHRRARRRTASTAARARIWEDAGGEIEAYTPAGPTDAVGRPLWMGLAK